MAQYTFHLQNGVYDIYMYVYYIDVTRYNILHLIVGDILWLTTLCFTVVYVLYILLHIYSYIF